jgi:hypothetical protein
MPERGSVDNLSDGNTQNQAHFLSESKMVYRSINVPVVHIRYGIESRGGFAVKSVSNSFVLVPGACRELAGGNCLH